MTRNDYRVIFTALGFLAVVLDNVPREKQALRAATLARLIEGFCATSVPEAMTEVGSKDVGELLEAYVTQLRETGSARLSYDRQTLLSMYEQLLLQQVRFQQREFFATGPDDVIANQILRLAEERIERERRA
ncbi:hypothetical protein JQ554_28455 [Bradyrhizobium diazoefficiens]|nr:hypothetical protein [Bradyrhizobium diazoefficiens]MBR0967865.1 hypothetical protein [Bradyrhizobium diazoefficiens]MBR0981259.1 hypothetical protein [Bradyrhizobium diazoefficiens]MBR1010716.1 hypothetical protein [Bradyrhizobium diazoefficiens]MBR1015723.1 hypothetical protein [Bradyrhizobium diazoefficiens]MBR1054709.1 hypothetical protein [Bradyrhizobium diazoefficiens]